MKKVSKKQILTNMIIVIRNSALFVTNNLALGKGSKLVIKLRSSIKLK